MCRICTPLSAIIFMDHFEKKYICPFLQGISLIYLWFIGDIFFIWTGSKEQLTNCLNDFNKKHNPIKFEDKISQTSITFIDTEFFIQSYKNVTKIYRKSTICQNFLQWDCIHIVKRLESNGSAQHKMTSISIVGSSNWDLSIKVTSQS